MEQGQLVTSVLLPHLAEFLCRQVHSMRLVHVGEWRSLARSSVGASGKALASQLGSPLENMDNAYLARMERGLK